MSKNLHAFLSDSQKPADNSKPVGMPWSAAVTCQFCGEEVDEQTLFPTDKVLVWECSQGHKSFMEGYTVF